MKVRHRFGKYEIHREEGERDRVYAIYQEDEAVETRLLLGYRRSVRTDIAIFGYGETPSKR